MYLSLQKRKENRCRTFMSSTNRKIRKFHVVIVQWQQRNVQKKSDARAKVFSLLILTFGLFLPTSLPSPFLKLASNARGNNACAALPWVSVLQPAYCNMHSTAQETPELASLPQWANGTHSLVPTSYNQYLQRGKRFSQLVADINDKLVILASHNLLTASAILARP